MKKIRLFVFAVLIINIFGNASAQDQLSEGKSLLDKKDCDGALPYLRAAVKDDPKSEKANLYLGDAYLCINNLDSAQLYFKKTVELDDELAPAYYGLGQVYLQEKKLDDAIKNLNSAVNYDSKNEDYLITLGNSYLGANQLDSAMQSFYKARDMNDSDPRALGGIGDVYRRQNIFDAAIENYKDALSIDSTNIPIMLDLANTYMQNNEGAVAYQEFVNISRLAPNNADAQREAGELLYVNKRYHDAVTFLQRYHQLVPNDYKALFHLAESALNGDDTPDAVKYYQEYLAKFPDKVEAKRDLAAAYFFAKRPVDSYNTFKTIPLDSLDVKSLVRYGQAANEVHDTTATIDAWSRAVKLDTTLSPIEYFLANTLFAAKRYDEAIVHFKKHLVMTPDDAAAELNMGLCYFITQDYPDAILALKRVGELKPGNIQGQIWLARAYIFAGSLDSAKDVYQNVIKIGQTDSSVTSTDLNEAYRQTALYEIIAGSKVAKEKPDEAKKFYNDGYHDLMIALKYDSKEIKTHSLLAQDYALLGKIDDACKEIKIVLRVDARDEQMLKLQKSLGCE
ncbi:MAG: tetratricopeptide repeat protein [Candidatus Kryptoniota bacterium]